MLVRLLPAALLALSIGACAQPLAVGPGNSAAAADGNFNATTLALAVDAAPVAVSLKSRLDNATQAAGYVAQLGLATSAELADGGGVTLTLTQLGKAPAMPTFTAADAGRKALTVKLGKGNAMATYEALAPEAIQVRSNGGVLDVAYTGEASLTAGGSGFKPRASIVFTGTGLPTSR